MWKKILLLILALSLLSASLVACGSDEETEETTVATESTVETEYLPTADYGGYEFTILGRENNDNLYLAVDELTDDTTLLDKQIYNMNRAVADRYNISFTYVAGANETMQEFTMSSEAGDDVFDIVTTHARHAFNLAQGQLALDWNTELPYVNLDAEWWPSSASDEFTIGGNLYAMCGDLSYMSLARTKCLYFNKLIFDDHSQAYPYELVKSGDWTFATMKEMALEMYEDVDGSGMNLDTDKFGYVTNWWGTPINILFTAGIHAFSKDSNGMLTLDIYSDRVVGIFDDFFAFSKEEGVYLALGDAKDIDIQKPFEESRAAFVEFTMESAITFKKMKDDFGIIPCPKYDENVEEYMTVVDASTGLFIVPMLSSDPERTSVILEAMAYYGNEYVIPEFYERTLSGQSTRDEDSIEMLETIRGSRTFDVAYFSGVSVFASTGYYICKTGDSFTALYGKNELIAQTLVQQLNNSFSK